MSNEQEDAGERVSAAAIAERMRETLGGGIDPARVESLVPQAEAHFALMRAVAAIDVGDIEPAGAFRLPHPEETR